jgi:hypothetical protein
MIESLLTGSIYPPTGAIGGLLVSNVSYVEMSYSLSPTGQTLSRVVASYGILAKCLPLSGELKTRDWPG